MGLHAPHEPLQLSSAQKSLSPGHMHVCACMYAGVARCTCMCVCVCMQGWRGVDACAQCMCRGGAVHMHSACTGGWLSPISSHLPHKPTRPCTYVRAHVRVRMPCIIGAPSMQMIHGTWYMIHGCTIHGSTIQVDDTWHMVHDAWEHHPGR